MTKEIRKRQTSMAT